MAEKIYIELDYPIIPAGDFHVVKAENVGWGEDDLDDVLQGINDYLEMHDGNIKNINDSISGLDTRVTALEESKGAVIKIKGRVNTVDDLPANASAGDMYFVGTATAEQFEEYVFTEQGRWEYLGSINDVDLSDYVTKSFLSNTLGEYAKLSDIPTVPTNYLTGGSQTSKSTADGGKNVYTFTKSDGTTSTLEVLNGTKGSQGIQGIQGVKGDTGSAGPQGPKGDTGSKGDTGARGTGIYSVTTAPSSYTTATGGFTPTYRIALSTVKTQSGATSIVVGDQLRYSYYLYPVGYVDSSYVYLGVRVSIRGATGATGATGAQGDKGDTGDTGPQGPKGDTGPQGPAGSNGTNGKNGTNGTSCTHSWNGTTLTVTSASGTSSANLKGEKGDKGDTGAAGTNGTNGTNGKDGVTPTIKAANGANIGSVGTPAVTASTSGTTTTFTFNYLKGAKGDKGDPGQNATTTATATQSANGLMSSGDKTKLDGIELTGQYFPTSSPVNIPNNADLNNYKTVGNFMCFSGAAAATISNCPTKAGAFRLIVTNVTINASGSDSNKFQWIIANNSDNILFYRRQWYGGASIWTKWYKQELTVIN